MEKLEKQQIMILGDHIPFNKAHEIYKKLQRKYPNREIHFYVQGIMYNDSNSDELEFIHDATFYRYFVSSRLINKVSADKKKIWASRQPEQINPSSYTISLETIKEVLVSAVYLKDALYCLMQYSLAHLSQGFMIPGLEEMLAIIKQRFYLNPAQQEVMLDSQKRKKVI